MTPSEEKIALQVKAHKEWLAHPVTHDALSVIKGRIEQQRKALQEGILLESNPEKENKLRVSINAYVAVTMLIENGSLFVEQLNKQNKE